MKFNYSCPKCSSVLNPEKSIILIGNHRSEAAIFAFHPEPGNYHVSIPLNTRWNPGEIWDFNCPICKKSLIIDKKKNLAQLHMMDGVGNAHKVVFSCVAGEKATCVINMKSDFDTKEYGANVDKFENCLWEKFD